MFSSEALWSLVGVLVGAIIAGIFGLIQQQREHAFHESQRLKGVAGLEHAKAVLEEKLNHRLHVERSFLALSRSVGFPDTVVRNLLHEIKARPCHREDGSEWWYLEERDEERIQKLEKKSTG